jgi:nitroimidazol reductase NimA-like FMN-containing flavoprotein (pyridoxamine 5'-phosphate oxidase superfamily)
MIEIEEMSNDEIHDLLSQTGYGHLGCCRNNTPYVVPVHYAYSEPNLYVYTTEGEKSEIIRSNPHVCLQVEWVENNSDWKSVIVTGEAFDLDDLAERERAVDLIRAGNPTLTPAVSIHWLDNWVRENHEVVYRIKPRMITGRKTVKRTRSNDVLISTVNRRRHSIC